MPRAAFLLPALLATILHAQPAAFEGSVTSAIDGRPLTGVHVRLIAAKNAEAAYGAISQTGGRFSINPIRPGAYILFAEYRGYGLVTDSPLVAVSVKSGEHVSDYRIKMTPRAVIAGHVLDEFGDPVENAQIEIKPTGDTVLGASLFSGPFARSDDRGYFRWSGAPGRYLVSANPQASSPTLSGPDTSTLYGKTWYPSAAGEAGAAPVQVAPGAEAAADIRLVRHRVLSIRGTVSGASGAVSIALSQNSGRTVSRTTVPADGHFAFHDLEPGIYTLRAQNRDSFSAPREVRLEASDADVQLAVIAGAMLAGTVEGPLGPGASIRFFPATSDSVDVASEDHARADIAQNGAFEMKGIPPEKLRVRIERMADGAFLKSLQLDTAVLPSDILDFSGGVHGSRLKVVVSGNAASVSGTVSNKKGDLFDGAVTVVFVFGEGQSPTSANVNERATYAVKGLRPGKYRMIALDAMGVRGNDSGKVMAMLKTLAGAAPEIELKEGDHLTRDLTVLDAKDLDGSAKL